MFFKEKTRTKGYLIINHQFWSRLVRSEYAQGLIFKTKQKLKPIIFWEEPNPNPNS